MGRELALVGSSSGVNKLLSSGSDDQLVPKWESCCCRQAGVPLPTAGERVEAQRESGSDTKISERTQNQIGLYIT
jgi:hypothetical protein